MAFNLNFDPSKASEGFTLIEKGEYECFISDAEITTFQSGNDGIKLTLTIRDDLPQKFGKRKLWANLVNTEKAMFMFHTVLQAVGAQAGQKFDSLEALARFLQSKPVRIAVTHRNRRNADGTFEAREDIAAWKPTNVGGTYAAPPTGNAFVDGEAFAPTIFDDDDLPF